MSLADKVLIWNGYYNERSCQKHSNAIFIFGDNCVDSGYGGQAIIRDQSNAFGIPTDYSPTCKFSDKNYESNVNFIKLAVQKIVKKSSKYDYIYFPSNGIGTGLACLRTRAPKTWNYLQELLETTFSIRNGDVVIKCFV